MVREEQAVSAEAVRAESRRIFLSPRVDARERSRACPAQPGSYRTGPFLCHAAHGRITAAPVGTRRVDARSVVCGHIAAAEPELHDEAADAVAAIRGPSPDDSAKSVPDLDRRRGAPDRCLKDHVAMNPATHPAAASFPPHAGLG
jgi:hypothetical protein